MPKKGIPEGRVKITIRLSWKLYSNLIESAKSNGKAVSSEVNRAVEFYLANIQREKNAAWQSPLEQRMQKLENRLAGLMAKLVRVCGQALWFSTLPYTKGGLPSKPLPKEAFQMLWDQSRAFAASWLKKAWVDEEQIKAVKVVTVEESGKQ